MTGKRITGTMRGLGALEVSENIKGAFIADDGLLLEDVGKLEKRKVVVYLIDDDPAAKDSPAEATTGSAEGKIRTFADVLNDMHEEERAHADKMNGYLHELLYLEADRKHTEITAEPPTMPLPFSVVEVEGEHSSAIALTQDGKLAGGIVNIGEEAEGASETSPA